MRALTTTLPRRSGLVWLVALCCACGGSSSDGVLDIVFDPCEPVLLDAPGATAEQRVSIDAALVMWRALGVTGPRVEADAGTPRIEVRFEDAAAAFHGLYDDEHGIIFINAHLDSDHERAVTVAHELGHALGMWHVGDRVSVMNPGNLDVEPTAGDLAALEALWGTCGPGNTAPAPDEIR